MYISTNPRIIKTFEEQDKLKIENEKDHQIRKEKKAREAHQRQESRPSPYKRPSTYERNAVNKELDREKA